MRLSSPRAFPILITALLGALALNARLESAPDEAAKAPLELGSERIDGMIEARLSEAKLEGVRQSSDAEFMRRVSFDLTGAPPEPSRVLSFLADRSPGKRATLVDELIGSSAYIEHWTDFWLGVLTSTLEASKQPYNGQLRSWVARQLEKNTPYDNFVSQLIRAQGYLDKNGAVAFSLNFRKEPLALASTTSRLFMGIQIECAQCHDHPFADWKQSQFLETAAWFSRMELRQPLKPVSQIAAELSRLKGEKRKRYLRKAGKEARRLGLFDKASGELVVNERGEPLTGKNRSVSKESNTVAPRFLFPAGDQSAGSGGRREAFARWMTDAENPYFAKMGLNRIWSRLFGRGLVNPIDDLSDASSISHPQLLEELASAFRSAGFDQRALLRALVMTRAYQRSSTRAPSSEARAEDEESPGEDLSLTLYARMPVRPLAAEPLARALSRVLFPGDERRDQGARRKVMQRLKELLGGRALDLDRYEETLQEALFMQNSELLQPGDERRGDDMIGALMRTIRSPRERVTRLFLSVLTRSPSASEVDRYLRYLEEQKHARDAYQDVAWVLLNSSEFRYIR